MSLSEFSLVIASLAVGYGHIGGGLLAALVYAMALGAVFSSYAIKYNHEIYRLSERLLTRLRLVSGSECEERHGKRGKHPIIILGYHRVARSLIEHLARVSPAHLRRILVIDFNTESLKELSESGVAARFGDLSSIETLRHLGLPGARFILSTIPDMLLKGIDTVRLVKACRSIAPETAIVAIADTEEQIDILKKAGASEVFLPYSIVAASIGALLDRSLFDDIAP